MSKFAARAIFAVTAALFVSCCAMQVQAAATLKGVVLLNQLGGSSVSGVQVVADGANPTASDSTGRFVLGFPSRKPGDIVRLIVVREGWVVVNDFQLERELPSDPDRRLLEIVISKAAEREQWALQFYRLKGREVAEGTYQRKLQELDKAQAATTQERERLTRERDQALAQADELARQLATAKVGERNDTYERALRLFLDGQLDAALNLLSEAQLTRQVKQATQTLTEVTQGYLLRGKLLVLKFQFDQAAKAYAEATRLAPQSFDAWFGYAYFHQNLNHFDLAGKGYAQALTIARRDTNRPGVAKTLNNLGTLHRDEHRYPDARAAYDEALAIRRELAQANPAAYLPDVALTLNNLGNLHRDENRYADARAAFEEALAIRRELAQSNPTAYRPDVAATLNNLAVLYSDEHRHADARNTYNEALAIYRDLAQASPAAYRPNVALTLNNLAVLHSDRHRYADARAAFEEALAIRRDLALANPAAYRPNVATTLNNLGTLHRDEHRYVEARAAYAEALAIRRELAQANPAAYQPYVATTLTNLGILNSDENRYADARKAYDEALAIYEQFAAKNPAIYGRDVQRLRGLITQMSAQAAEPVAPTTSPARAAPTAGASQARPIPLAPAGSALVIGNSAYEKLKTLPNAGNDARDICDALKRLDFQASCYYDLSSRRAFREVIKSFVERLGPTQTVFIYYAGHGIQSDSENYLLPTSVDPRSIADIKEDALSLTYLLRWLEGAHSGPNVVILDACRQSFAYGQIPGLGRGLAATEPPANTLLVYATAPNESALDWTGTNPHNGLFAKHLLAHLQEPGLTVDQLFSIVAESVSKEAQAYNYNQLPYRNSALSATFCLAGCPTSPSDKELEEINQLNAKLVELRTMSSRRQAKISQLAVLKARYEQRAVGIQALKKKIAERDAVTAKLSSRVQELQHDSASAGVTKIDAEAELKRLRSELGAMEQERRRDVAQLKQQNSGRDKELAELRAREADSRKLAQEVDDYRRQEVTLKEKIDELRRSAARTPEASTTPR